MIKIGLIGCGNIGHIIANHAGGIEIVALFDSLFERAKELEKITGARAHEQFDTFISEDFDIVVEAASVNAVMTYAHRVLEHGKDLVIMSVGALADPVFREGLRESARRNGKKIYIPSGAIFGLDNNIEIFGNKGIKLFVCPCTGNLSEFLCPVKKNIKKGNNLNPPGVVRNNVPDVTTADQTNFDHVHSQFYYMFCLRFFYTLQFNIWFN